MIYIVHSNWFNEVQPNVAAGWALVKRYRKGVSALQYQLGHREISQLDHRENKAYTLRLSKLLVFIAVAKNTDGFFNYQIILAASH